MPQVMYKIYIPFHFEIGNVFSDTDLIIYEFDIGDIHIRMQIDACPGTGKSYLIATTNVDEDGVHEFEDISDIKVGSAVQRFFDGISKGLCNSAFFNVYNGDGFVVKYEMNYNNWRSEIPYHDSNNGHRLDDKLVSKAIEFANSNNEYLNQAFLFLKEGEYLVDIGRFSNAIIQFAAMTEYLINYQLRKKELINSKGEYIKPFRSECKILFGVGGNPSFAFSKYVYGLIKLNLTMEKHLIDTINDTYLLRNKLAHGYDLYEAFQECNINCENEQVTKFNIWGFMMDLSESMTSVYNFFADNFDSRHND